MSTSRAGGFNFLEHPELPAPAVSDAQARTILAEHYDIQAAVQSLGSQQDKNFLVRGADGSVLGVLKIANPAFGAVEIEAQDRAARHIAEAEPQLRVAVPLPNSAGGACTAVDGMLAGTVYVRLLRHLDGGTLDTAGYLTPELVAGLGNVAGRVSRALRDFDHPGLDRVLQWDLRFGMHVVDALIGHVGDTALRQRLQTAAREAWDQLAPLDDALPRQAAHIDLTDANVVLSTPLGTGDEPRPDGVIDFGDLCRTWAVSELAITASSVLGHPGATVTSILPAIRAFHAVRPLSPVEAAAVWPMLMLRTVVLIVSGAQQVVLDPDNDYLTEQADAERQMFELATSVGPQVMSALITADLGLASAPAPLPAAAPLTAEDPAQVHTLDLSTTSDLYDDAFDDSGVLRAGVEDDLATAALHDGARVVVSRYGEARLSRAPRLSQDTPAVVATGVTLWATPGTVLSAPWDGQAGETGPGSVTLHTDSVELTLVGVTDVTLGAVRRGGQLARVSGRVEITARPVGAPPAPAFTSAELWPGWSALTRDPRPLLGLPPPTGLTAATCWPVATRVSLPCRSSTTAHRRRSNVAGGIS